MRLTHPLLNIIIVFYKAEEIFSSIRSLMGKMMRKNFRRRFTLKGKYVDVLDFEFY
jgi:hypothetical protein